VCLICVSLVFVTANCQDSLRVTTDKTTCIVFPNAVLHVDRGSKDILVQPVKESGNLLLVKAGCADFHPTNLSVLTADGSLYSFYVYYDRTGAQFVYKAPVQVKASVETYASSIIAHPPFMRGVRDHSWDIFMRLAGIYIKGDVIYYQLSVSNKSPIDYDIDFLRFYTRDKRKSKRTATQENELKPVYIAGNTAVVRSGVETSFVIALNKFTIPDAKYLAIEMNEKNGGRNLLIRVGNRKIVKAIVLPDLF